MTIYGRLEDRIRDSLAANLHLLGDGLTLVAREFPVANPSGSGGRIDIVAKDRFGQFVIIEVKRSDPAARAALNEVHKYTALFRQQLGLDEKRVRVVVASTAWDELLLPLAECAATLPYTVEGIRVEAQSDGSVTRCERVTLPPLTDGISVSRAQAIYLFVSRQTRDAALAPLVQAAATVRIADYFVLAIDHDGVAREVCYPFGLYFAFSSPLNTLDPEGAKAFTTSSEWDSELDLPEENFLIALNRAYGRPFDDFEIGGPDKLTTLRRSWKVGLKVRAGRLQQSSLLTDDDLLRLAQATEGGGSTYLHKCTSPRFTAVWRQFRKDLAPVLLGMPSWEAAVSTFLDEIEVSDPGAAVSAAVYNPANLLLSLYLLIDADSAEHCPSLDIVVEGSSRPGVRILSSRLMWTGTVITLAPADIMNSVYGDRDQWMLAVHFNSTFEAEGAALQAHGLVCPLVEFTEMDDCATPPHELAYSGGAPTREMFSERKYRALEEFAQSNQTYLRSLKAYIDGFMSGLARSKPADDDADR